LKTPAVLAPSMRAMPAGIWSLPVTGTLGCTKGEAPRLVGSVGVPDPPGGVGGVPVPPEPPAPGLPPVAVQMQVGRVRAKAGATPLQAERQCRRGPAAAGVLE
jgi:hypothetical protein